MLRPLLVSILTLIPLWGGEVRGTVVDARGGEALARVRVLLSGTPFHAATDSEGRFEIESVPDGSYTLQVETVGYRLLKRDFDLQGGEGREFQVILSPDTFRRTDSVDVREDPFEAHVAASTPPSQLSLADTEIKNLGTVFVDDPLRAVQSLPGVVANNDFYSQFSVYGVPYSSIGLYLDDVLLHAPFHTVQGVQDSGSISMFNGDSIENLSLMPVAFPAKYMDRFGSALDVRTREGSRTRPSIRVAASVAQVNVLAEGPVGQETKGSWLASVRKSYVQYVARRLTDDPSQAAAYTDGQVRFTYDLTQWQSVTLYATTGTTGYERDLTGKTAGVNSLVDGNFGTTLARAGWRYLPGPQFVLSASAAYIRERYDNFNRDQKPLGSGYYGEWVGNGQATWVWSERAPLEMGWTTRRLRTDGFAKQYLVNSATERLGETYRGTARRQGGYAQQSWITAGGRVRLSGGVRADEEDVVTPSAVSPQASAGFGLTSSTQIELGWGQYVQYPELAFLGSNAGGKWLLPERANHAIASLGQRFGRFTRLRVEFYDREIRDDVDRPLYYARLINGRPTVGASNPPYANSIRGYTRGVQFLIQSRSANRVSGWASYTLGYARSRDGVLRTSFWSEDDQRHTVNLYLSYRFRPSWNLSGKFGYGSGCQFQGFSVRPRVCIL